MPELPEVETCVRELRPRLIGRTLRRAWAAVPRQLGTQTPQQLARAIKDQSVIAVERRGKYILLRLERGMLLVHLRMTGRLYVDATTTPPPDYARAGFTLDDGRESLYFRDVRTLGTLHYYRNADHVRELAGLGWEPLDVPVTHAQLKERLAARAQAIKVVLLDQNLYAGIGNIYASEACWVARIDPRTSANKLSRAQCERLCAAVPDVLRTALDRGGSSLRDFMSPDGNYGSYQKEFRVYDRENEECLRCNGAISKIVQAQRSTYFCPKCQKKR